VVRRYPRSPLDPEQVCPECYRAKGPVIRDLHQQAEACPGNEATSGVQRITVTSPRLSRDAASRGDELCVISVAYQTRVW
jgi:hypothetical protein